jgi:hypothetical protein
MFWMLEGLHHLLERCLLERLELEWQQPTGPVIRNEHGLRGLHLRAGSGVASQACTRESWTHALSMLTQNSVPKAPDRGWKNHVDVNVKTYVLPINVQSNNLH